MIGRLRELWEAEWHPVPRYAVIGWGVFYLLFLWHALNPPNDFRWIDNANFVMHEAGHLLFSWMGHAMGIAGGTLFQFFVPAALAAYFFTLRNMQGFAFCVFFFFENFLYSAGYIADARAQNLDLMSVGGGDAEHDWLTMLSWWGLLAQDTLIAKWAQVIGWSGMIGTVGWFGWRGWGSSAAD